MTDQSISNFMVDIVGTTYNLEGHIRVLGKLFSVLMIVTLLLEQANDSLDILNLNIRDTQRQKFSCSPEASQRQMLNPFLGRPVTIKYNS